MTITTERAVAQRVDPTVGFRRRAAAIALPLGFAFQMGANSIFAWTSTSTGMTDTGTAEESLAFYAAAPGAMLACGLLALIGCLLTVPGLPAALRVLRPGKPRLALWAVALMMLGYVCYFGIAFTTFDTIGLATVGTADAVAAYEATQGIAVAMVFFLLFVIGNLGGTLLLGLAVILGGRRVGVPWWSGLLIAGWTVGHVINIMGGGEWFAVAGGALEVVGLSILAATALRLTNAEWVARG